MANYKERYSPVVVGVNTSVSVRGNAIGGFVCKTAGTVTLTNLAGTILVDAVPVTAGVYLPLPFLINNNDQGTGGVFTTAGGASGTLGV